MMQDAICADGYSGPPAQALACAVTDGSGMPNLCVIVCVNNAECPPGLECLEVPKAGFFVCAAP
jgi:hypothetical protein